MTNDKDREDARVLLGELSDLFDNAFDATDDHAFVSPEEKMIDAIVAFRFEAVNAELERCEAIVTEEILEYDCELTSLVNTVVGRMLSIYQVTHEKGEENE